MKIILILNIDQVHTVVSNLKDECLLLLES